MIIMMICTVISFSVSSFWWLHQRSTKWKKEVFLRTVANVLWVLIGMGDINRVCAGSFRWTFPSRLQLALNGFWKLWNPLIHFLFWMCWISRLPVQLPCWIHGIAYAHDVVVNDRLKRESQEHLDEMKKTANDKGFQNVEVVCARGDPAKISCFSIHVSS